MRPPTLNSFAVHPSSPLRVGKVELDLAGRSVTGQMELGNEDSPKLKVGQFEGRKESGIAVDASLEMFLPLAADIIRDKHP